MSRHKNIAGIIKDSYYDDYGDYGDEDDYYVQTAVNKKKAGIQDEDYDDEVEEPIKVKKKKSKTASKHHLILHYLVYRESSGRESCVGDIQLLLEVFHSGASEIDTISQLQ